MGIVGGVEGGVAGYVEACVAGGVREDPWNDKCCSNGFLPRGGGGLKTLSKWFGAVI